MHELAFLHQKQVAYSVACQFFWKNAVFVIWEIAEGLGQILVALHTFLVLIEMNPCLNIQIDNNRTGRI